MSLYHCIGFSNVLFIYIITIPCLSKDLARHWKGSQAFSPAIPTLWETEAGRLPWVCSQPRLHSEFQASLSYSARHCLRKPLLTLHRVTQNKLLLNSPCADFPCYYSLSNTVEQIFTWYLDCISYCKESGDDSKYTRMCIGDEQYALLYKGLE